ncbi:MAG: hypothetical protein KGI26_06080 [Thaumarchaeota archaeon]|nr:hypothetical protein [Nitrososphaerota archaeon]
MSASVRLAVGEGRAFALHLLAMSSLVALLAASEGVREVVASALPLEPGGGVAVLLASFLAEVDSLLSAWLVPVWLLTAAAAFVVTYDSARAFGGTSGLLFDLGGASSRTEGLFFLRLTLLASLSFLLGMSLGLVATQVVFRAFLVLLGAQYFVPEISPAGLGLVALLSLSAVLLGSGVLVAATRIRRP